MLWFVTFADSRMSATLRRIHDQACAMNIFGNRVLTWNENDLPDDFREKMKDRMLPGAKRFGFWCWKPQIILRAMDRMEEGDVLLYADAGSHLNRNGLTRLAEYASLSRERGIVAFQARSRNDTKAQLFEHHFLIEKTWCKRDLIDYLGLQNDREILETGQYQATAFLVCKNQFTIRFFNEMMAIFFDHFDLCDDTPSRAENFEGFHEHRFDQSVFSLMCKREKIPALSMAELEPIRTYMPVGGDPADWPDKWSDLNRFPVWVKRDKGQRRLVCPDWMKPFISIRMRMFLAKILSSLARKF